MKHILLIMFIAICALQSSAQNLAFYFELIPEAQLPHLKPEMRKGMVGLYELGQQARVPNMLGGVCVLDTLSSDYLSMHTSDISTMSIKMISVSDSTSVLAVIHTVKAAGTLDSSISFFTNTWSKLNTKNFIDLPSAESFYKENQEITLQDFKKYCIPLMVSYSFGDNCIIAELDPEKYLPTEVFDKIKPGLNTSPIKLTIKTTE